MPCEEEDRGEDEGSPSAEMCQGDGCREAAEDGAEGSEARYNRGRMGDEVIHAITEFNAILNIIGLRLMRNLLQY